MQCIVVKLECVAGIVDEATYSPSCACACLLQFLPSATAPLFQQSIHITLYHSQSFWPHILHQCLDQTDLHSRSVQCCAVQAREEKLSTFCEFEEIAVFSLIIRLHCSPAAAEGALIISNYPLTHLHRTLTHPPAYKGHHLCGVEGPHPSIWADLSSPSQMVAHYHTTRAPSSVLPPRLNCPAWRKYTTSPDIQLLQWGLYVVV